MGRILGRQRLIGVGLETTRGTAVAPGAGVPALDGTDFQEKFEKAKNESGMGRIEKVSGADVVKYWGEGKIVGKIFHNTIGYFLTNLFGASDASPATLETGVYQHDFEVLQNTRHKSMTIAVQEENEDNRYPLAMIDKFSIETDLEKYLEFEVAIQSRKPATASNTIAYATETEFLGRHVSIRTAAPGTGYAAALEAASDELDIISAKLEVNKNLKQLWTLNRTQNPTPYDIINTAFEVEGELEVYYGDLTWRNRVKNNTELALRFMIQNDDALIGATKRATLNFEMPRVNFEDPDGDFSADDPVNVKLKFNPLLDAATATQIVANLFNTRATAY